jgi:hypothetical protein
MNTAKLVKTCVLRENAHLYHVTPPMEYGWGNVNQATTEYVIVSAVNIPFGGPETYIFAANAAGEVIEWAELPGSYRGGLNHTEALRRAGYTIQA